MVQNISVLMSPGRPSGFTDIKKPNSVGAKSQILSSVAPPGRKIWPLFSVRGMSWDLGNPCFTKFSVVNFL